jgi:ferredoxin
MLKVNRKYCTGCRLCVKNCPTKAITVTGGKARINNDLCNDCGRCVYVCPSAAIQKVQETELEPGLSDNETVESLKEKLGTLRNDLKRLESEMDRVRKRRP